MVLLCLGAISSRGTGSPSLVLLLVTAALGAAPDSLGVDFAAVFPVHGPGIDSLQLIAPQASNVSVQTPGFPLRVYGIRAGSQAIHSISSAVQLPPKSGVYSSHVVRVRASTPISVLLITKSSDSLGTSLLLPLDVSGPGRWLIPGHMPQAGSSSGLVVAATRPNTAVQIRLRIMPPLATIQIAGTTYRTGSIVSVNMADGELLQLLLLNGDLSGTEVTSLQPLSVTSFVREAQVPVGRADGDMLLASAVPVNRWGTEFVLSSFPGRDDIYTLLALASQNDTWLTVKGTPHYLAAGGTLQLILKGSEFVSSSKPAAVTQFSHSYTQDYLGEASMLPVVPVEQYSTDFFFATPDVLNITHFVSITAISYETRGVRIDNNPIRAAWQFLPNTIYATVSENLSAGVHRVHHISTRAVLAVSVSGFRSRPNSIGYAYPAGRRLRKTDRCQFSQDLVADGVDNDCDGLVDEEEFNCFDDDHDGSIDEDVSGPQACAVVSASQSLLRLPSGSPLTFVFVCLSAFFSFIYSYEL